MFEQSDLPCPVMNTTRRTALKGLGAAGVGLAWGLPASTWAEDAPDWPAKAFAQKTPGDAIKALFGKTAEASDKVSLDAPEIAENGAVVPISFSTSLPGVTSMALIVAENPFSLAATFKIPDGTMPSVSCRLKMAKTSTVTALVEAGGKLYSTSKEVKVTLGGCGG